MLNNLLFLCIDEPAGLLLGAVAEAAEWKGLLCQGRGNGSGGEEEIRMLEEIVALDPLDGEALILLGQHCADALVRHAQLLVQQTKYAEALPLLRRAQDLKSREDVQKYLEQVERVARSH